MGSIHVNLLIFLQFMVVLIILLFIGFLIYLNIREITQWRRANKQPILTVHARAVTKRTQLIHHVHQYEIHLYYPASTFYYVTFALENGEQLEVEMNGIEFKQIVEGVEGRLTYQGNEFIDFTSINEG